MVALFTIKDIHPWFLSKENTSPCDPIHATQGRSPLCLLRGCSLFFRLSKFRKFYSGLSTCIGPYVQPTLCSNILSFPIKSMYNKRNERINMNNLMDKWKSDQITKLYMFCLFGTNNSVDVISLLSAGCL